MPELPEVETIKNDLRGLILQSRIERVRVLDPRLVRQPPLAEFEKALAGQRVAAVDRRAKYLLLRLSAGMTLLLQLFLTGQLIVADAQDELPKSTRMILDLEGGRQLRLVDRIHLARAHLLDERELTERLAALGPDANSDDLTPEAFAKLLEGRGRQVKPLLLDQHVIAGLGDMYVDEVLFEARIHPLRRANSLSDQELRRLHRAIRHVLAGAIEHRGTSKRAYLDARGRKGSYQEQLKVVFRQGEACIGCPGTVAKIRVANRPTYYCPSCQVERAEN